MISSIFFLNVQNTVRLTFSSSLFFRIRTPDLGVAKLAIKPPPMSYYLTSWIFRLTVYKGYFLVLWWLQGTKYQINLQLGCWRSSKVRYLTTYFMLKPEHSLISLTPVGTLIIDAWILESSENLLLFFCFYYIRIILSSISSFTFELHNVWGLPSLLSCFSHYLKWPYKVTI